MYIEVIQEQLAFLRLGILILYTATLVGAYSWHQHKNNEVLILLFLCMIGGVLLLMVYLGRVGELETAVKIAAMTTKGTS